ncbi:DUF2203 domain-containing protein [Truepera radiovictrix]|uniref:DUF2203 family protein n=1 Tax=Truepera radiovictrix (strain DSM 17093 / CIP 108686 / LMG 22925 / RQ-24) TaxID=649638 RepID=D7CXI9_TRURR|nr:DUF2203 domain-containing protein [Truepera radiovictrix]ADI14591.1 Protein of unknown function DUF2203 [Truepera radiovictrix DSM 17093]WMT56859.1 DUF2203 domain-containing protein [Truepera radiovictrix]
MYKLFTKEQATALLPVVDEKLRELQGAVRDIAALRSELQSLPPTSLRAQAAAEELKFVMAAAYATKQELDRMGVFVQDLERGLVDFPSRLGAEVVYLCWEQGEDAITHFHRLNQGVGARRPLPLHAPNQHAPTNGTEPRASA